MPPEGERCPACNAGLVSSGREYVAWCRSCDYNVDPTARRRQAASGKRPRWFERQRRVVEQRLAASLYDELAKQDSITKPGWDLASIVAILIALAVYAFQLGLMVLAIWGLVLAWRNPVMDLGAFLLLAVAFLMRPRFGSRPAGEVVSHRAAPELYAFVDALTRQTGGPRIGTVIVDETFNARATRVGLRRRPMIAIGLPLWNILDPQERVALLGHEVGHFVNGDLRRGFFVGSALAGVAQVHRVLRGAADGHDMGGMGWASMLAGRDAALRCERTMQLGATCLRMLTTTARRSGPSRIWSECRAAMAAMPDQERDRLWRLAELEEVRADSSHPSAPLRYRLLEATTPIREEFVLAPEDSVAIDEELAPAYARIGRLIRESDRAAMLWP